MVNRLKYPTLLTGRDQTLLGSAFFSNHEANRPFPTPSIQTPLRSDSLLSMLNEPALVQCFRFSLERNPSVLPLLDQLLNQWQSQPAFDHQLVSDLAQQLFAAVRHPDRNQESNGLLNQGQPPRLTATAIQLTQDTGMVPSFPPSDFYPGSTLGIRAPPTSLPEDSSARPIARRRRQRPISSHPYQPGPDPLPSSGQAASSASEQNPPTFFWLNESQGRRFPIINRGAQSLTRRDILI